MAKSTSYPVCKKKFTSSSHHKSVVTLESNHLVFCVDQQFIERKIYYKEIYSAQIQRVNHIFYFGSYFVDTSIYLSGFESNGDLPVSCFEFYFDVYFFDLYSPLWKVFICGAYQSNGCRHLCFLYQ